MAAYVTQAQLEARYGSKPLLEAAAQKPAESGAELALDSARLEAAIADVSAEIDGALRGHYSLPLPAPTPPLIVSIATRLVFRRLLQIELAETDPVRLDAERAERQLEQLRLGDLSLQLPATDADGDGLPDARELTPGTAAVVQPSADGRVFTRAKTAGI